MTKILSSLTLSFVLCASAGLASAADKNDAKTAKKTAKVSQPLTANSTGEFQRKMLGKHIDLLPEAEESTKAVDNPDRIVCKKIERLGSRLRKRKVCATKKEWDQAKSDTVRAVRTMQLTRGKGN